jgi:hypothetical protein
MPNLDEVQNQADTLIFIVLESGQRQRLPV